MIQQDKMKGVVTVRLQDPIRRSPSGSFVLLAVGLLLLLYPVFWILMLQYRRDTADFPVSVRTSAMDAVGYFVLDMTPQLANGGLALFLAAFFFLMGRLKQEGRMR